MRVPLAILDMVGGQGSARLPDVCLAQHVSQMSAFHRYFGFITKHPADHRFACHVFVSEDSTKALAESVGYVCPCVRVSVCARACCFHAQLEAPILEETGRSQ